MSIQKLFAVLALFLVVVVLPGCAGLSTSVQQDAKHIEITNSGLIIPLSPDPAGAALIIGTRRLSIDSVPVYTVSTADETVTQFQSLYEEYEDGDLVRKVIDTISFCNDTHLGAVSGGTGGDSSTIAQTSSGNAATDRCQQNQAE